MTMKTYLLAGTAVIVLAAGGAGAWWKLGHKQDLLAEARAMLAKGDSRAAAIDLRRAVSDDPSNGEAHFQLGMLQLQAGDPVAAEKELKAARSLGLKQPLLPLMIAQSYLQQVSLEPATPRLNRAREMLSEFPTPLATPLLTSQLLILRSLAQSMLNDPQASQVSLAEAERLAPDSPAPAMAIARSAMGRGDLALAEQKLERAIELEPKRPDIYLLKGQVLARKGDLEGAMDSFNAALVLAPKMLLARLERANLLVQTNQDGKARTDVDAILAEQPNAVQAIYLKAILLARAKDYANADLQFQRIVPSLDRYPRAYYFYALVKYNLGQLEQAVEAATHYAARTPGDPDAAKLLARVLIADGHGDRALDVLSKAAAAGAADAETLDMLGRALAIAGKSSEAVQSFDKAAALAPANAEILNHLATAKLGSGDASGAAADFSRSLQISPGQANTAEALVVAGLAAGDTDKAAAALATLRQQTGNTETVGLLNGQLLMMQQNLSGARAQFESLLADNPKLNRARFGLAQVLVQQSHPAEAEQVLTDLVNADPTNIEALSELLQFQLSQGKIAQAVAATEAAHKAVPASQPITLTLANLYVRNAAPDKALALLAEAEKTATPATVAPILALRAQVLIGQHREGEARAALGRILAQSPADLQAVRQLLALNEGTKDWEQSRNVLRQALLAQPGDPVLLRLLAGIDLAASGEQAALATIARLQADPVNRDGARTLKADFYVYTKHPLQAAEAYAALLQTQPSSALVQSAAKSYVAAGQAGQAKAVLQGWLGKHPDDAAALGALGTIAMTEQQWPESARLLEQALALQPNVPVLLNNLAWVYQQQNDPRALATGRRAYLLMPNAQSADTLGWILLSSGAAGEALPLLSRSAGVLKDDPQVQFHFAAALKANGRGADAAAILGPLANQPTPFAEQPAARQMLAELQAAK